jgi:hypothetical protein
MNFSQLPASALKNHRERTALPTPSRLGNEQAREAFTEFYFILIN